MKGSHLPAMQVSPRARRSLSMAGQIEEKPRWAGCAGKKKEKERPVWKKKEKAAGKKRKEVNERTFKNYDNNF